jgi:hypothetical protein
MTKFHVYVYMCIYIYIYVYTYIYRIFLKAPLIIMQYDLSMIVLCDSRQDSDRPYPTSFSLMH